MRFHGKARSPHPPTKRSWPAALATAMLLAACGGGGGDANPASDVRNGRFLDAAVQGLTYETPTQSGTTDATGRFTYKDGETVTFKLYGERLSASPGYSVLTPGDTGLDETDLDAIVNQLRFLQTIDIDANPANGIRVPTVSPAFSVNFKQSIQAFETDAAVAAFLTQYASSRALVSVKSAVEHFNATVKDVPDTTPVLDLRGKTLIERAKDSNCSNQDIAATTTIVFSPTYATLTGSTAFEIDEQGVCTNRADETDQIYYDNPAFADEPLLACAVGPCSYKEANGMVYRDADSDGRTAIEMFWHTPGSKKISVIKRILLDPSHPLDRSTKKSILTWN